MEVGWKVFDRCLKGVWKVTSLSPTQLGTNYYLELEFDSGVKVTCKVGLLPFSRLALMPFCHNPSFKCLVPLSQVEVSSGFTVKLKMCSLLKMS